MALAKKILYLLWVLIVVTVLIVFILSPSSFNPNNLATLLIKYESQVMLFYIFISMVRGLILVPSTPFVLAGIILFPDLPWTVLVISMIGIIIGSTVVYYFSDLLRFSRRLEKKYPQQIEKWHQRLNSPKATLIVIGWSFFPLVPTDIICYVAGIVKMPFRYLITGVIIGELVLVYLYIFFGGGLLEYFLE